MDLLIDFLIKFTFNIENLSIFKFYFRCINGKYSYRTSHIDSHTTT
ncbi:Uncharacterised protein [Segatella copri]|nr:Uncharacterised protein [Segatella copri]